MLGSGVIEMGIQYLTHKIGYKIGGTKISFALPIPVMHRLVETIQEKGGSSK